MTRHLLAVAVTFALACGASAQQPKPAQPKPAPPKSEATKRLAEEVESLEAHLVTKKAYIRAAQVAVSAAEFQLQKVAGVAGAVEEAKLALEAAKAQLAIREAEANEVAVKVKHAKRRAEEEQKAEAGRVNFDLVRANIELTKAQTALKRAEAEMVRLEELAKRGIVAPADYDAAAAKVKLAKAEVEILTAALEKLKKSGEP
jgi:multidrug resistance efflux pump